MRLDEIDRQIVAILVRDARRTYAEVGAEVGLSAPAVKRRVDRLRADDVIQGYAAVVNPAALGWATEAFVHLYYGEKTSPTTIMRSVQTIPEVVAAYSITGDADALLHVRVTGAAHLEVTLERIRDHGAIRSTRSEMVLSRLVSHPVGWSALDPD